MKKMISLFLAIILVFSLTACGAQTSTPAKEGTDAPAEVINYTVNTSVATCTPAIQHFIALVSEYSGGRLKGTEMAAGVLGGERECAEAVSMGNIDVMFGSATYIIDPSVGQISTVFSYNSHEECKKMLYSEDSVYRTIIADALGEVNMHYLGHIYYSRRYLSTVDTPLTSPDSFKGLQPRVPQSNPILAFYESLGTQPAILATNEVASSLQQGAVDGVDDSIHGLTSYGALDLVHHVIPTPSYGASNIVVNGDFYASLSPEDQAIFDRAGAETEEWAFDERIKAENAEMEKRIADGTWTVYEVTPEIQAAYEKAYEATQKTFLDSASDAGKEAFALMQAQYEEYFG